MRATLRVLVMIASLASTAHAGPWGPVGPSTGGISVGTHATVPGTAMIGGLSGALSTWATTDAGAHWTGNPWRTQATRPWLAGSPTIAWMGPWRSTDLGRSWAPVAATPPDAIDAIAGVNPDDPDELVALGYQGVLHTTDGGMTWRYEGVELPLSVLAVDWTTRQIFVALGPVPTLRRRSLDTPASWIDTGEAVSWFAAGHGTVLVESPDGSWRRSIDGGATFSNATRPPGPPELVDAVFARPPSQRAYAMIQAYPVGRILVSDDRGSTWVERAVMPVPVRGVDYLAIDAGDANRVYASTIDGVVESTDGGVTVHALDRSTGAPGQWWTLLLDASSPARQWVAPVVAFTPGFLRTLDGGGTWQEIASDRRLLGASRLTGNRLFGNRLAAQDVDFSVSADGGTTWQASLGPIAAGDSQFTALGHGGAPGQVLVAGRGFVNGNQVVHRLFVSNDDGASFVERSSPPLYVRALASGAGGSAVFYAGGFADVSAQPPLWRSTDGAATWTPVASFPSRSTLLGAPPNDVHAIAVDPTDANRIYVGLTLPDALLRSSDGGATWSRATAGLGAGAVVSIVVDPAQPSTLYVAVMPSGVFRSTDFGASWHALDDGLRDEAVRQVARDPLVAGRLYAVTESGLWRSDLVSGIPAGRRRAIEFYHAGFDHYFVSADIDEIAGLDAGVFAGWTRTGEGFRVAEGNVPGNQPVCRFFGTGFAPKSSHFYTPYPGECDIVKADPNWFYEKVAFGLALPEATSHGCPPDTRPIYRAWNRNMGGAPNHRYAAEWSSLSLSVLRQGWVHEGEAATLVFACVPV